MTRPYSFGIVACLFLLLGACSPFKSNQPPVTVYALQAAQAPASVPERRSRVLAVFEPAVPPGFETNRIAVHLDGGRKLDFAAGASWPSSLTKTLQEFIIQSARAAPRIQAETPDFGLPADYNLLVKVNDFSPWYPAGGREPPLIKISMSFVVLGAQTERLFSNFTLDESGAASANTLTAITADMEGLLQEMLAEAFRKIASDLPGGLKHTAR